MERKVYHVVPAGSNWQVKVAKQGLLLGTFTNKQTAIDFAVTTAKANQQSQVVIHRRDGTIENEWTYGNDPYPPPG